MLKQIIQLKLKLLAQLIIKRYQPKIVAVTGSVGKTSTREAIAAVLGVKMRTGQNRKNYNNEFGLPLTLIGSDTPGKSLFGWFAVFLKASGMILFKNKNFPEVFILEMGVDHPGDMAYLTEIVQPDIAVVTTVGQSHLEYFGNEDNLAKEKGQLVRSLKAKGFAVLNYDDERVRKMEKLTKTRVFDYGFSEKAKVRAQEISYSSGKAQIADQKGLSYKLTYNGSFVPVRLPDALGKPSVYASLAAASVGLSFGMNLVEIAQALEKFSQPKGRLRLIDGIDGTILIDDTYNASPQSTLAALEIGGSLNIPKGSKRFAVLGDMLELGGYTVEGHQAVGQAVVENHFDYLFVVGERSLMTMAAARDLGLAEDSIFHFSNSEEVADVLKGKLNPGDLVLIKGSQGMRMERVAKSLLAEPEKASDLLVRQDWPDA